jgi:hypothetical protein
LTQDGKSLDVSSKAWLVKRYIKLNGFEITKRNMREGLLKEIWIHEQQQCQSVYMPSNEYLQDVQLSIDLRLKAWEHILALGGVGQQSEGMNDPIDPTTFHNPEDNLTTMILMLYSIDTFLP